jgi:hypothetical protein
MEEKAQDIDGFMCPKKAIKILNPDTRRIGSYATIWGERDCENDRMTRAAIEPYIGKGNPFMFWLHGLDDHFGSNAVGVWDTTSFKADNTGLFVEGNVGTDEWGNQAWDRINDAGSFGLSVGSFWYLVKKNELDDGSKEITNWPLLDISLMEGGKQCVPSARQDIKGDMANMLMMAAIKMGMVTTTQPVAVAPEQPTAADGGDNEKGAGTMTDKKDATVDIAAVVAEQVEAALKAKDEAARKEREQQEAIANKAAELAQAEIEKAKAEFDAELAKANDKAEQAEAATKQEQPKAPAVGNSETPQVILGSSPYDRFTTLDLAIKYELLRSYGKQPSNKMWRALADRAVKLTKTEDTIGVKNGQPVKVPAVDWEVLVPKNLDLTEVDGDVYGIKAGQYDRFAKGGYDRSDDPVTPRGVKQFAELAIKANELVHSTQASFGDEWVPTLMSAELWRTIRLNAALLPQFTQFDMPSQPYDYPIESTDPTFYKVAETTAENQLVFGTNATFSDSKIGTSKITFSANKLGAMTFWSEEMEEDSIIAVEPTFRDQYGIKFAHVIDEVLISGDETTGTANISYEGSTIDATTGPTRMLVVDGLRHESLVTTTADSRDGGTLTVDDFGNTQALMGTAGKFGVNPMDLLFVMDPAVWHKAKLLGEVLTVDKFGAAATIVTGQLGSLFGVPLIVSEDYSLTDTTGRIDETAGDNTKGSFFCVNKRGVLVGWRRRPRIRVVGIPGAEARYIMGSARFDIRYKEAGMVGLTYNLTV